jgi:serine/threonine protein kinase
LINPRIRLLEELGRGAMGSVWIAEHLTLDTQVAVKLISEEYALGNHRALERFEREAKVAAKINSLHVVRTLDHGVTEEGEPYIVLELLEGESLRERLERAGRLTLAETSRIVTHVSRALSAAHHVGIIHRDIKPGNIFCTEAEGRPFYKVLDFGVAKLARAKRLSDVSGLTGGATTLPRLTAEGTLIGTPEYMSPEQLGTDDPVTQCDDLWSLAVVAYECLTNALPYDTKDFDALSRSIILGEHTPPSERVPDLPPEVDAWFSRALARRAVDRHASAESLARSFADLSTSLGTAATHDHDEHVQRVAASSPPAEPLARKAWPRRRWWLGGLALAVVVAAAAAGSMPGAQRAPTPTHARAVQFGDTGEAPVVDDTVRMPDEESRVRAPAERATGDHEPRGRRARDAARPTALGSASPAPSTPTASPAPPSSRELPERELGF